MIGCFALIIIILGICIFAFVWQFTRKLAFRLLAMGIGIVSLYLHVVIMFVFFVINCIHITFFESSKIATGD